MKTKIRFFVALGVLAAIVIAGVGAPAWADRLNIGASAPLAGGEQAGPVAGRPQGSVQTTGGEIPITGGGKTITVGSCATVEVKAPAAGVEYVASIVTADVLPTALPANLLSCGVKIEAKPGATLGSEVLVCFPVPPTKTGFAYYWDGGKWVKTALDVKDGQSCVTIPASVPSPAYAGLFDK